MLKIRQICLPVVLSLFAAMPAQAKVTPIHEYNQAVVDDGSSSITITCETYNYYDSPVTNAICTQQNMPDGTVCYSCRCDTSDFPYTESDCGTLGFVNTASSCELREGIYYSTCPCDTTNGWYDESEFVSNVASKFTITSSDIGKIEASGTKDALTCYRASGFSCKTGTSIPWSDIKSSNNSTYFTYTGIPHKNGSETCYAVSSCNTANGYEQVYLGIVISTTDFTKDDATNYTYDVDSIVVSITNDTPIDDGDSNTSTPIVGQSYQMTCRVPNGCRTDKGYYNFVCDGGCWDGWLSLWMPR